MELISRFDRVWIHKDSVNSEVATRLRSLFPEDKIKVVDEKPLPETYGTLSAKEFTQSKRQIYVQAFKGKFFHRCPGSRPGLACCNYFVLNLGLQCDMNCSYCYLQSFLNTPFITIYSNIDQALQELRELGEPNLPFRIGTGEVIDSLSLDPVTLYSRKLIEFFKDFPKWRLEFKTKSAAVDQFLDAEHAGNVIASWSLNPQNIIEREEGGTASLDQRLNAARKCRDKGFQIAFHLDPMIYHPEWRESYARLSDEIMARFKPEEVSVMSLGALRFQTEQRHMMRERFGFKSLVTSAEVFQGQDGKLRYDQRLREEMFGFMIKRFKDADPKWNIFLCMEQPETWLATHNHTPKQDEALAPLYDYSPIRSLRSKEKLQDELRRELDQSQLSSL